jgi:hypothetical protein
VDGRSWRKAADLGYSSEMSACPPSSDVRPRGLMVILAETAVVLSRLDYAAAVGAHL